MTTTKPQPINICEKCGEEIETKEDKGQRTWKCKCGVTRMYIR